MINELNMKLLRFFIFVILAVSLLPSSIAAEWQWSVQISGIVSNETNDHPQAFLWIPSDCVQVKGVMIGTHNMTEETLFENALFREIGRAHSELSHSSQSRMPSSA